MGRKVVVISISLGEKPVTIVTQKNHKMPKITYRKKRYMSMQVGLLELSKLRKKKLKAGIRMIKKTIRQKRVMKTRVVMNVLIVEMFHRITRVREKKEIAE